VTEVHCAARVQVDHGIGFWGVTGSIPREKEKLKEIEPSALTVELGKRVYDDHILLRLQKDSAVHPIQIFHFLPFLFITNRSFCMRCMGRKASSLSTAVRPSYSRICKPALRAADTMFAGMTSEAGETESRRTNYRQSRVTSKYTAHPFIKTPSSVTVRPFPMPG